MKKLVCLVLVFACSQTYAGRDGMTMEPTYRIDVRTCMCFALWGTGGANVACTPKVRELAGVSAGICETR